MRSVLILGSNLGNREQNLENARKRLFEIFPCKAISPVLETEPVGFEGGDFLNQAVAVETDVSPEELLSICKGIETCMGRADVPEYDAAGRRVYHDRIIDIDILKMGELEVFTPELTIPHPQMESRPYVKILLASLK